ncbi:hypothetical protein Val02_44440 [Virgisporangium aliadipatigenens]|uniref:Methyltransferase type 11 domain-containing protein n=1 Tax=Virgisporangium aliadipatigenens TaxID=741659 RepID=A0A8J3YPQ7_9ACTN|nr:methyltransferase domain-containing protein [Virgisporangium aliadipatigenens]GIJ47558.1 hypothetical protein Val02_44440 [Virgisporangium aliadipatigenens]
MEPPSAFAVHADRAVYTPLVRPLLDALADVDGTVLDIAAGNGALTALLPDAVALDRDAGQLRANPAPLRVRADAACLPFADDTFAAAACGFGLHHFAHPAAAIAEMARVAPVVAVLTWARPDVPYPPREAVVEVLSRSTPRRTAVLAERRSERVGHPAVLRDLMAVAGLRAMARYVTVTVPWPGTAEYVAYRLGPVDFVSFGEEAIEAVDALGVEQRRWTPRLVLAVGHR